MPTKPTGRPRGRPKGAKNIPTPSRFVADSLTDPIALPARSAPPAAQKPRGPWAALSPEERVEFARRLGARRDPATYGIAGRKKGVPLCFTAPQWEAHKAVQLPIIHRIIKKMATNGQLPDDTRAEEAMTEAMLVLRSPVAARDKLAAARLVLDFTKAKPTTKVEHTVKTAEDILDEMAEDPE